MPTHQDQQSHQAGQDRADHPLEQSSGGASRMAPPFQLAASTPPPPASYSSAPVQRQIGNGQDKKQVIHKASRRVYTAHLNQNGSYDLYANNLQGQYVKFGTVAADDDAFDVFENGSEPIAEEQGFTFTSSQKKRRVYTGMPSWSDESKGTSFHQEEQGAEADFSYGQASRAYHGSRKRRKLRSDNSPAASEQEAEESKAISHGARIDISDGELDLDTSLPLDPQLAAAHLRKWQHFHTPDTLQEESKSSSTSSKPKKKKKGKKPTRDKAGENLWRAQEHEDLSAMLETLGSSGMDQMLPELDEVGNPQRLRDTYPGPIDIGFPPNEEESLFTYPQNKAIYLLNKKMRLQTHQEERKTSSSSHSSSSSSSSRSSSSSASRSHRRIHTDSFFDTVRDQEDSTAVDPQAFTRRTMGLRRSDSKESLAIASDHEDLEEALPELYQETDDVDTAVNKRKTFLNALGVQIKDQNRKVLSDQMAIAMSTPGSAERQAAEKSLARHQGILDKLEADHARLVAQLKAQYAAIAKMDTSYKSKLDTLLDLEPEEENEEAHAVWEDYTDQMGEFRYATPVGDLIESGSTMPLSGIGAVTMGNAIGAPPKPKKKKKAKKKAGKSSSSRSRKPRTKASSSRGSQSQSGKKLPPPPPAASAAQHEESKSSSKGKTSKSQPSVDLQNLAVRLGGGQLLYGSSDGNNCLIYAIGGAAYPRGISLRKVNAIRSSLGEMNMIGVNPFNSLPAYGRIVDYILNQVLSDLFMSDGSIPSVKVTVHSVVNGINSVSVGNGSTQINVLHDGIHYWWLKR